MIEPSKAILLTGAGFTHNFGGYLARDMWAQIFSHGAVQKHSSVKRALRNSFSFETAYDEILYGNFNAEEKKAIVEGLTAAFADLDEIVKGAGDTLISFNSLAGFVERFGGAPGTPGYVFTLNQDLFGERQIPFDGVLVTLPGLGVKQEDRFNRNTFRHRSLDSIRFQLPGEKEVRAAESEFSRGAQRLLYVKLHGSTEWLSHDGSVRPVIGRQKTRIIEKEPLLSWYGRLLWQALTTPPNRKLLIIGYGFEDPHINEALRLACADYGLRFYVVDPAPPEQLRPKLTNWSDKSWLGWSGYFRCTLHDLFARNDSSGQGRVFLRNIIHALFE